MFARIRYTQHDDFIIAVVYILRLSLVEQAYIV